MLYQASETVLREVVLDVSMAEILSAMKVTVARGRDSKT